MPSKTMKRARKTAVVVQKKAPVTADMTTTAASPLKVTLK